MIDYSSLINFISSDKYVDRTDCFSTIILNRYETLENCKGIGSSLFLKTMACFLDNTVNTTEVFHRLKIGLSDSLAKEMNSYSVLYLDFSDFDAKDYSEAVDYLRVKMSETYKHFYKELSAKDGNYFDWRSQNGVFDIIERIPSEVVLLGSLRQLMLRLRGYENHASGGKLAVLIDNMVQLETVAKKNNYSKEMDALLRDYIVEDVYKYCDIFLQISDTVEDMEDSWYNTDRHRAHWQFSVHSINVKERFPEIIVAEEYQVPFHCGVSKHESINWEEWIAVGRREVGEAVKEEKRKRQECIRQEKARYTIELLPSIPRFSSNMGIRAKRLDKQSPKYSSLNMLLKKLYVDASPNLNTENVYCLLQSIDYEKNVVRGVDEIKAEIEQMPKQNAYWEDAFVNTTGGDWVQVTCRRKGDESWRSPARAENIKVYAYIGNGDSQRIFTDSIRYLLTHARQMFAAKMAIFERADQMCYWIDPKDYPCLVRYFDPYFDDMEVTMPFVAYKGKLGISKDFPGSDDSHNLTQAHIISDYFKTVKEIDEIDLEAMYNNYIAKWNADLYEEDSWGFKGSSALSLVVIMDTLDSILCEGEIDDQSSLLSLDGKLWRILAESKCWADVNEGFVMH